MLYWAGCRPCCQCWRGGYHCVWLHVGLYLDFCLPFPFPFSPFCFLGSGCERMSANCTGSANRSVVIFPKVTDVLMWTAISQAKVSHEALMFGSLCAFRRVSVLNRSMYVVTSFSVPSWISIQATCMASSASKILLY